MWGASRPGLRTVIWGLDLNSAIVACPGCKAAASHGFAWCANWSMTTAPYSLAIPSLTKVVFSPARGQTSLTHPPVFYHKLVLCHGSLHRKAQQAGIRMPPALTTSNKHGRCITQLDEVTTHLSSFPPPPPSGMLGGSIPSPDPGGHQPGLERKGGSIWGRKSLCEDGERWQGISKLPPAEALLLMAGPPISLALHPAARSGPPRHRGLGFRSSPMRTQEREPHGKRLAPGKAGRDALARCAHVAAEGEGASAGGRRCIPPVPSARWPVSLAHLRPASPRSPPARPLLPGSRLGRASPFLSPASPAAAPPSAGAAPPLSREARPGGLPARRRSPCAALPGRARLSLAA